MRERVSCAMSLFLFSRYLQAGIMDYYRALCSFARNVSARIVTIPIGSMPTFPTETDPERCIPEDDLPHPAHQVRLLLRKRQVLVFQIPGVPIERRFQSVARARHVPAPVLYTNLHIHRISMHGVVTKSRRARPLTGTSPQMLDIHPRTRYGCECRQARPAGTRRFSVE